MNKVAIGIVALLILVGVVVYASRSVINRGITQIVPRPRFQPIASVSPLPQRPGVSPIPFATPQPGATSQPGSSPGTQQVSGATNFTVSPRPAATSGGTLPATGL